MFGIYLCTASRCIPCHLATRFPAKRETLWRNSLFPGSSGESSGKEWKQLKGTRYSMFKQFPKAVADKRRKLVKLMKDARDNGKRAWLVYDTLYVDDQPVRE
ncbi:hypothetical protein DPMN_181647 [Dreissena polymorpha]|uniref:Uncharacterized protein n=1 Tax=Dreissena polymorpha TaxID=45954 RepID=A0A9D4DEU8_DREPO|nr:hypothetical protein DPMN_181647 [Dreissena polymorpha]